jgi:hypothetical protein
MMQLKNKHCHLLVECFGDVEGVDLVGLVHDGGLYVAFRHAERAGCGAVEGCREPARARAKGRGGLPGESFRNAPGSS